MLLGLGLCFTLSKGFNFFPFCVSVFVERTEKWSKKREAGSLGKDSTEARKYK